MSDTAFQPTTLKPTKTTWIIGQHLVMLKNLGRFLVFRSNIADLFKDYAKIAHPLNVDLFTSLGHLKKG